METARVEIIDILKEFDEGYFVEGVLKKGTLQKGQEIISSGVRMKILSIESEGVLMDSYSSIGKEIGILLSKVDGEKPEKGEFDFK